MFNFEVCCILSASHATLVLQVYTFVYILPTKAFCFILLQIRGVEPLNYCIIQIVKFLAKHLVVKKLVFLTKAL